MWARTSTPSGCPARAALRNPEHRQEKIEEKSCPGWKPKVGHFELQIWQVISIFLTRGPGAAAPWE
jgi:hypothetical protein